jgi:hypothetical protein
MTTLIFSAITILVAVLAFVWWGVEGWDDPL